jgi:hypothetical protein
MEKLKLIDEIVQHLLLETKDFEADLIEFLSRFKLTTQTLEGKIKILKIKQITNSVKREWSWNTCKTTAVDPLTIDWSNKIAPLKSITLNSETVTLPYDPRKPFIPDLSAFHGKTYTELLIHVQEKYGKTHYLPGFELNDYYTNNPNKIPIYLKNSDLYFLLPGSSVGFSYGDACVAFGNWTGLQLIWGGYPVVGSFNSTEKVVLFERTDNSSIVS